MWYVYICDRKGQLYTGITTDLQHRMIQHGAKLLYFETQPNGHSATQREKEIKRQPVQPVHNFNPVYQVYIRANDHYRVKSEDFKNLYARNARGEMVPLGGLLEAKHSQGSEMISRYNLYSAVAIFGSAAPGSSSGQALTFMELVDSLFSPRLVQVGWWTWWSGRPLESRRGQFPLQFCIRNA